MKELKFVCSLGAVLCVGCSGTTHTVNNNGNNGTAQDGGASDSADAQAAAMETDAGTASARRPDVRLRPREGTAPSVTTVPALQFSSPRADSTLRTNRLEARVTSADWNAPADGKAFVVVLDDTDSVFLTDATRPATFVNLTEGTHTLRAFPAWANGEVLHNAALSTLVVHVGAPGAGFTLDATAPILSCASPTGRYTGPSAEAVPVDFHVANLGSQSVRVRYRLTQGETEVVKGELTESQAQVLEQLPNGDFELTLQMLGADGQPLSGRQTRAQRRFSVQH